MSVPATRVVALVVYGIELLLELFALFVVVGLACLTSSPDDIRIRGGTSRRCSGMTYNV